MFSHLPKDGVVILRWQAPLSRIERDAKKALHRVCAETQRVGIRRTSRAQPAPRSGAEPGIYTALPSSARLKLHKCSFLLGCCVAKLQ